MSGRAMPLHERTLTEAEWTTRVIDTARAHGWHVNHARPARTAAGYRTALQGDRGAPDLLLARGGTVLVAELKSARGRLGPGQREWLDAAGDHARFWRPSDWPEVLAELSAPRGDQRVDVVPPRLRPRVPTSRAAGADGPMYDDETRS